MKTITAKELIEQEDEIKKRCVEFIEWYYFKKYRSTLFLKGQKLTVSEMYDIYQEKKHKDKISK